MSTTLFDAFQTAETAWREGLEAPALPSPLGELMAALQAAHRGDADELDRLADALQQAWPAYAQTLRGLLGDAPTEGLPNEPHLRLKDLMEAWKVTRTGRPGPWNQAFLAAAGARPFLHNAFRLLVDDQTEVFSNPVLAALSPRANDLQLLSRAAALTPHTAVAALQGHLGRPLRVDTDPADWPALHEQVTPGDLLAWRRTRAPWTSAHGQEIQSLLAGDDRKAMERALCLILQRVGRDVPLGRLTGLANPVRAAQALASRLLPATELPTQLAVLQVRTDHFDPEVQVPDAALTVHLWRHRAQFRPETVLEIGRRVVAMNHLQLPPDVIREATWHQMAHLADPIAAGDQLLESARGVHPQQAIDELKAAGASAGRMRHLMCLHAACVGYLKPAFGGIPHLANEPEAARILSQVLRTAMAEAGRRGGLDDDAQAALTVAIEAMAAAGVASPAWAPLLGLPGVLDGMADDTREAILTVARQAGPTADAHAASIAMMARWGEPGDLKLQVRLLGRWLRSLHGAASTKAALDVIAWWFTWDPKMGRELVDGAGWPVVGFLARHEARAVNALIGELPFDPAPRAGLLDWWFHGGKALLPADVWRSRLLSLIKVPDWAQQMFEQLLPTVELREASSLAEAITTLQSMLQKQVDAQQEARP